MAIGIAFVLFASFAVCFGSGDLEHGQQCTRSVDCKGELVCRSRMCICPNGVHYLGDGHCAGVMTTPSPKGYDEACTAHGDCNGALGLGCKRWRRCGCYPGNHWDPTTTRCVASKMNGETCTRAWDCVGDLICNSGTCGCGDNKDLVGDSTCQPKPATPSPLSKIVGEACTTDLHCKGGKTVCTNSVCACGDTNNWEWDDSIGDCKRKPLTKLLNEPCTDSMECKGRLWCVEGKCNCKDGATYEDATDTCRKQKTVGDACELSSECVGDLWCRGGTCKCLNGVFDGTSACNPITTQRPKTVGEACESSSQCLGYFSYCIDSKCSCMGERQWVENDCQIVTTPAPKRNGDTCEWSIECIGSLYCVNSVCGCTGNKQWDDATNDCKTPTPKNFRESCTAGSECLGSLDCINSKCACPEGRFHIGSGICIAADSTTPRGYGETCASDAGCKYPFACSSSACACPSGASYLDHIDVCATESSACGGSTIPSDGKCYAPVSPQAVSGQTGYGGACTATADCPETTTCRDGGCFCPEGGFYIGTLGGCAKITPVSSTPGSTAMLGRCQRDSDCKMSAWCLWGQCSCPFNTAYYPPLDACLSAAQP